MRVRVAVIRTYVNASFVNLTLARRIYEDFEKLADLLGIKPELMINDALVVVLKEIQTKANFEHDLPAEKAKRRSQSSTSLNSVSQT